MCSKNKKIQEPHRDPSVTSPGQGAWSRCFTVRGVQFGAESLTCLFSRDDLWQNISMIWEEEEKKVSEYAKWMEKGEVSEYTKWMEKGTEVCMKCSSITWRCLAELVWLDLFHVSLPLTGGTTENDAGAQNQAGTYGIYVYMCYVLPGSHMHFGHIARFAVAPCASHEKWHHAKWWKKSKFGVSELQSHHKKTYQMDPIQDGCIFLNLLNLSWFVIGYYDYQSLVV